MASFLIAGLGNIGEEYVETRHNVGFKIVDEIASKNGTVFTSDRLAQIANFKTKGKNIYLIKPTTYMNLSGKAVRYWMQDLKIPQENILVVLDDLALPFGAIRIRAKGHDGGHNGLKDIDLTLGNNQYARLRFGIGNDFGKGQQVNHVLGKWSVAETKLFPEKIPAACEAVQSFVLEGLANAMTKWNRG